MRKKDNIRYDVHHPGSAFPLCHPFSRSPLVDVGFYSFIIDLPHGLFGFSSVFLVIILL